LCEHYKNAGWRKIDRLKATIHLLPSENGPPCGEGWWKKIKMYD